MTLSGWDITSSLALSAVNSQLAANADLSRGAFDFQNTDMTISGHFASWQIVPGGSGSLVLVDVSVKDGAFVMGPTVVDLTGIIITLELSLQFLSSSVPNTQSLCFDLSTQSQEAEQSVANFKKLVLPANSTVPLLVQDLVATSLAECVGHNPAAAAHVFATLTTTGTASTSYTLPAPTAYAFAYAEPEGGGDGYFSIFTALGGLAPRGYTPAQHDAMFAALRASEWVQRYQAELVGLEDAESQNPTPTNQANIVGGQQRLTQAKQKSKEASDASAALLAATPAPPAFPLLVDPGLFDENSSVAVGMSPYCLMNFILLPQLPAAYHLRPSTVDANGAYVASPDLGSFVYNAANNQITLSPATPLWMTTRVDGTDYNPQTDNLSFTLTDTQLQVAGSGTCHISAGVDMPFSFATTHTVTVGDYSLGLKFIGDSDPAVNHSVNESTGVEVGNFFTGSSLTKILQDVSDSISHGIANNFSGLGITHLSPSFINWSGFSMNSVDSAGLEDILYFRGSSFRMNNDQPGIAGGGQLIPVVPAH